MQRSRKLRCVLIADDLTGACDAGVQFVRRGLHCELHMDWQDGKRPDLPEVLACSTDTRDVAAGIAAARISCLVTTISSLAPEIIFKKVDSTFRGNVAAEVSICLEQFECDCALIAPAYPAMQRTVTGGVLRWQDCSGANEVDIGPALTESLGNMALLPVPSGTAELLEKMQRAMQSGTRYFLADSAVQEDLVRLVAAGTQLKGRVLWVGSAGLAMAVAGILRSQSVTPSHESTGGPMLFCIGSNHPVTLSQQEVLLGTTNARLVKAGVASLESVRNALREGHHVAVQVQRTAISDFELREFFLSLIDEGIAGMLVTGGDTGACICRALGVHAISLQGEIAPGLPWGIARCGPMDGMQVATKSGGFGTPDALIRTAEFFSGKIVQ